MENLPLKQTLVQTQKNNSVRLGSLQQTKISLPMKPNWSCLFNASGAGFANGFYTAVVLGSSPSRGTKFKKKVQDVTDSVVEFRKVQPSYQILFVDSS